MISGSRTIFLSLLILCSHAAAEDIPAVMVRVHDGDTIVVNIPGMPYKLFSHELLIRIRGIDCPESDDPDPIVKAWAKAATDCTRLALPGANQPVLLQNVKWDKYGGRIDADVEDVSTELLSLNLAKPYDGKKKIPWKASECKYP